MAVHLVNETGAGLTLPATITIMDLPRQRVVPTASRLDGEGGVEVARAHFGELEFVLTGTIQNGDIRAKLNELLNHLSGRVKVYPRGSADDRYLLAQMTSFSRPKRILEEIGDINVAMRSPSPFLWSDQVSTIRAFSASPESWSPTIQGEVPVRPVVTITSGITAGAQTAIRVTDVDSGLFVEYSGTLDTSEVLVIDCENYTMSIAGTNVLNQAHESFLVNGFELPAGVRNLEVTVGAGAPDLAVELAYQPRWYW